MVYLGLLYQELLKTEQLKRIKKLPPVLPIVIFNGQTPWTAPLSLEEFWPPYIPNKLKQYQLNMRYWLLDVSKCKINLNESRDFLSPFIALENIKDLSEFKLAAEKFIEIMQATPGFESLKRVFFAFFWTYGKI